MAQATFGGELLQRPVLDGGGERLGLVIDLVIDVAAGQVTGLIVELEPDLDPSRLPWPSEDRWVRLPVAEVASIDAAVHLNR